MTVSSERKTKYAKSLLSSIPRGMQNMGSTCFMNAALQVILHTPYIKLYFLSGGHKPSQCSRQNCMACAINRLYLQFYNSSQQAQNPAEMLELMWQSSRALAGYQQHDAHEFYTYFIDRFHLSLMNSKSSKDRDCDCIVHKTFFGELRNEIVCESCLKINLNLETFIDIGLDFRNNKDGTTTSNSLLKSIEVFFNPEKVSETYRCSACMKKGNAIKRVYFTKSPLCLCIQLRRFEHTTTSAKVNTAMPFPLVLDLTSYQSQNATSDLPKKSYIYDLYGVVVHIGNIDSGHYVNYLKSGRHWFLIDDTSVTSTQEREVLSCQAYLLFYQLRMPIIPKK